MFIKHKMASNLLKMECIFSNKYCLENNLDIAQCKKEENRKSTEKGI